MDLSKDRNINYKSPSNRIPNSANSGLRLKNETSFYTFEFEKIDREWWGEYMLVNWHFPIYAALIYILVVFGVQRLMENRKPFQLKRALFLWNAALGIYSIIGFLRNGPEWFSIVLDEGFHKSACFMEQTSIMTFWSVTFVLSKYVELGDTLFIVLRKKPLQFIQWYHHILTMFVTWTTFGLFEPVLLFFGAFNFGVHSLMYPYFALKALDIHIPRPVAKLITTFQLVQMILGFYVNSYTAYEYYSGSPCVRYPSSIRIFVLVYGSFAILFARLFYSVVASKTKRKMD